MKNLHLLAALALLTATTACIPLIGYAAEDEYDDDGYAEYAAPAGESDPLEGFNRVMHDVNYGIDYVLLDPLAETYDYVLPRVVKRGVYNFLDNLQAPVVFANSLFQADPQNTFVTLWRFIFNSTLGVAGLFDMASEMGMPPRHDEDFGQTMGVWGMGHGAYLVLPLMGPSSLRDATGTVVDILLNPFTYALKPVESIAITATRVVDARARYDKYIDQINQTSLDPYATFRSLYLQRRNAVLSNRQPTRDGML